MLARKQFPSECPKTVAVSYFLVLTIIYLILTTFIAGFTFSVLPAFATPLIDRVTEQKVNFLQQSEGGKIKSVSVAGVNMSDSRPNILVADGTSLDKFAGSSKEGIAIPASERSVGVSGAGSAAKAASRAGPSTFVGVAGGAGSPAPVIPSGSTNTKLGGTSRPPGAPESAPGASGVSQTDIYYKPMSKQAEAGGQLAADGATAGKPGTETSGTQVAPADVNATSPVDNSSTSGSVIDVSASGKSTDTTAKSPLRSEAAGPAVAKSETIVKTNEPNPQKDEAVAKEVAEPPKPIESPAQPAGQTIEEGVPTPSTMGSTATVEHPRIRLITDPGEPAASGPPDFHKVQLRLSGSMCFACLNTLKKKLKQVYGVEKVRVEKPINNLFQPYAPDVSSWAEAAMIYDVAKVGLTELRAYMRSNGYVSYKVVDKILDEPVESFKEGKF